MEVVRGQHNLRHSLRQLRTAHALGNAWRTTEDSVASGAICWSASRQAVETVASRRRFSRLVRRFYRPDCHGRADTSGPIGLSYVLIASPGLILFGLWGTLEELRQ